jgi:hypothetical protein
MMQLGRMARLRARGMRRLGALGCRERPDSDSCFDDLLSLGLTAKPYEGIDDNRDQRSGLRHLGIHIVYLTTSFHAAVGLTVRPTLGSTD